MKAALLGSLKNEERENFRKSILSSKKVLDKYVEIVYNMLKEKESVKFTDYDSPSWSHRQAHTNGFTEACRQFLELLDVNPKETNLG